MSQVVTPIIWFDYVTQVIKNYDVAISDIQFYTANMIASNRKFGGGVNVNKYYFLSNDMLTNFPMSSESNYKQH